MTKQSERFDDTIYKNWKKPKGVIKVLNALDKKAPPVTKKANEAKSSAISSTKGELLNKYI